MENVNVKFVQKVSTYAEDFQVCKALARTRHACHFDR